MCLRSQPGTRGISKAWLSGTSGYIWAMNHGLRQRIFKSAFVIARGQEGEQMLRSFNHACHALHRSAATGLSRTIATTSGHARSSAVCVDLSSMCVCVQKRYLSANLSQVVSWMWQQTAGSLTPHSDPTMRRKCMCLSCWYAEKTRALVHFHLTECLKTRNLKQQSNVVSCCQCWPSFSG